MCHLVDPASKAGEASPRVTLLPNRPTNNAGQAADSGRTPTVLCEVGPRVVVAAAMTAAAQQAPISPRYPPSPSPAMEQQGCQKKPGKMQNPAQEPSRVLLRPQPACPTPDVSLQLLGSPAQCRAGTPQPCVFRAMFCAIHVLSLPPC